MFSQFFPQVSDGGSTSTVAGNAQYGYSGDGAAATSLSLASPHGIVVSPSNDLYIADTNNFRIRKVFFHFVFHKWFS